MNESIYPHSRLVGRGLVILVIVLALASGYLYSDKQGWLKSQVTALLPIYEEPRLSPHGVLLPKPEKELTSSVYQVMKTNVNHHVLATDALSKEQIAAILWAGQGTISPYGDRTAPSYKALYPLQLRLMVRRSPEIVSGVYRYDNPNHELIPIASLSATIVTDPQQALKDAPIIIGVSAKIEANRDMIYLESGQAVQNIYLAVQSLGLGSIAIPYFDNIWHNLLAVPNDETLLLLMPVGKPQEVQANPARNN